MDHSKHRQRRAALNPFFSAASARRLQPVVEERVRDCIERFRGLSETREVVRLVVVVSAFANGRCQTLLISVGEAADFEVDVIMM